MELAFAVLILLLILMTSASCQQTAEDWFNKGDSLLNLGKYNESIDAYNKAIELNQSYAVAWKQKGNALLNLTKYNESLECYNEAIRLDPDYAMAWNNKGNALNDMGNSMNPSSLTMRPSGWIQNKHQTTIQNVVPPQDATEYDTASIDLLSYYCSSNRCQE